VSDPREQGVTSAGDLEADAARYLDATAAVLTALAQRERARLAEVSALLANRLRDGHTLFTCGNGGSAADAQHIGTELGGQLYLDRPERPAIASTTQTYTLTASGNSRNIVRAIEAARQKRMKVVGLTGADGGKMDGLCDVCLRVPSTSTPRIQECHILVGHTICELLEQILC